MRSCPFPAMLQTKSTESEMCNILNPSITLIAATGAIAGSRLGIAFILDGFLLFLIPSKRIAADGIPTTSAKATGFLKSAVRIELKFTPELLTMTKLPSETTFHSKWSLRTLPGPPAQQLPQICQTQRLRHLGHWSHQTPPTQSDHHSGRSRQREPQS